MKQHFILQENGLSLEFLNGDENIFRNNSSYSENLSSQEDMYILQEIIIVPPDKIDMINSLSAQACALQRCNRPMVFMGSPELPVQYSSIAARIKNNQSVIQKNDAAIKISSDDVNLLYSAPLFSKKPENEHVFTNAFLQIREIINDFRMRETDIVRTWLFMRDILKDYDELNKAREAFFEKSSWPANHFFPASTGIQNRIIGNEILAFQFCAFSGENVTIKKIASPLQDEPTAYGKLFSRAVAVCFPICKLLLISGTASINQRGRSVHVGDFESQMKFTLEIMAAILKQENCDYSNIVQAIIYIKKSDDMYSCFRILDKMGFPRERALCQVNVDVCRDDLLCEIEATAVIR